MAKSPDIVDKLVGKFRHLALTCIKSEAIRTLSEGYRKSHASGLSDPPLPAQALAEMWIQKPELRALDIRLRDLPSEVQAAVKEIGDKTTKRP